VGAPPGGGGPPPGAPTTANSLQPASAAIPFLAKAIAQMETEDGWVSLGAVGQRLANIASDFDPRTYGFRKLSDLIRKTGAFDMEHPDGRTVRIRIKPPKPAAESPPARSRSRSRGRSRGGVSVPPASQSS
jgi:hypothetical protein